MTTARLRLPLLLSLAALLAYHGGLHAWQALAAAVLLTAAVFAGPAPRPSLGELRLALACSAVALAGVAWALRPQAHLNAWAFCGGLGAVFALARRERRWRPGQAALAVAVLGNLAVLLFLGAAALETASSAGAARWIFPNQNLLAGGLALPAMLVAAAWISQGRGWAWVPLLAGGAALVFAGSRGVYLAAVAGCLWMALRAQKPGRLVPVMAALFILIGLAAWKAPFSTLARRMEVQAREAAHLRDENFYRRLDFWRATADLSRQAPWRGHGLGSFPVAARRLDLPAALSPARPIARYRLELEHAHNEWLELAVETGWPWTLFLGLATILWLRRRWLRPGAGPASVALESGLVAGLALSFFDLNFRTPSLLINTALILAALEPAPAGQVGGRRRLWAAAAAVLVLLALGHWLGRVALGRENAGRAPGLAPAWAASLQPMDAELQALRLRQGRPVFPWADACGRHQSEWLWPRAEHWRSQGRLPRSLALAQAAVQSRPYWAPGWLFLAQLQAQSGTRTDADASIRRALDLEPNFSQALAWQVDQALVAGRIAEARALLRRIHAIQALKVQPESLDSYSAFIQVIPAAWLESRNKKLNLSTGFGPDS